MCKSKDHPRLLQINPFPPFQKRTYPFKNTKKHQLEQKASMQTKILLKMKFAFKKIHLQKNESTDKLSSILDVCFNHFSTLLAEPSAMIER